MTRAILIFLLVLSWLASCEAALRAPKPEPEYRKFGDITFVSYDRSTWIRVDWRDDEHGY